MAKTLVLGANGFIGSHLVDSLVEKGHTVRAFDRFGATEPQFVPSEQIERYAGDYLNLADLEEALRDVDYVFHFISTTTPATAENDPVIDIDTNIRTSVELFKLCVESGVKRVLFASTGGAIYGGDSQEPHKETDPTLPVSPYAIGKLAIENYLRYFQVKHGLASTTFRISNPYGDRQAPGRKQGVIPIFLEKILHDQPITVLGDGSMVRDYVYVKDVADMIADAFEKENLKDVYNIGSGEGVSITELVTLAEEVTGKEATVDHQPTPPTFVHNVTLDTSRYREDFGSRALMGLREGMRLTYESIKKESGSEA